MRAGAGAVVVLSVTTIAVLGTAANGGQKIPGWWFGLVWAGLALGVLALGGSFIGRVARASLPQFGRLDYVPEFSNAVAAYALAQQVITDAMVAAAPIMQANSPLDSQAKGQAVAAASHSVTLALEANVATMWTQAAIMDRCLSGILATSRITSPKEATGVDELRRNTVQSRIATEIQLETSKNTSRIVRAQRRANLSVALNESTLRLDAQLKGQQRVLRQIIRNFRGAELAMWRQRAWYVVRHPRAARAKTP